MKHIFTSLLVFFSFFSFSQVITFECNNEIITVSFDEIANSPNAYVDWDGDGLVDENDYLLYLLDVYNCDNEDNDWGGDDDEDNDWGGDDDEDNDWGGDDDEDNDWGDVFTFECNGEEITIELTNINNFINYELYIESILSDYDCDEWSDNEDSDWGDNDENNDWNVSDIDWNVDDWEDFNWAIYWDEFDLNDIDWENIIWDIIIELDLSPEDFIDYIISIIAEGQPFNWDSFFASQGCIDDDLAIIGGLSSIGVEVEGCVDAVPYLLTLGYSCSDQLTIPGLGSIMPSDVCCATCEEGGEEGCMDLEACNYDSDATVDDGSCEYGVQCLVSPCSVSDDPGIDGAYCVDDYCEGCCAFWYYPDGTLISNSCEDPAVDDSIVGLWYDNENDQYVEITEDVIGFYTFVDDLEFMCWYYWSMEYTSISDGLIEVVDPESGNAEVAWSILDNGNLEILDPEGETIVMSPVDELPELEMCDEFASNEGCEDFQGQWVYLFPNTEMEVIWMEIDEFGVDFFILGDDLCVDYFYLSYDSIEGSDDCTLFVDAYGGQFEFGQLSINNDGTLSFVDMPGFPEDWPTIWSAGDFDSEEFMFCSYGCTDPNACNFDPFANADDGTCGVIDDCGDCQVPYCYTMSTNSVEYVSENECDTSTSIWIGNDCENNSYCLSSPENLFWNAGCVSIDEYNVNNKVQVITNLLGQTINQYNSSSLKLYFYQNGDVKKQQIIK